MRIPVKRLCPEATVPTRAFPTDAGADLYALNIPEVTRPLQPGERRLYDTGIALEIPSGYYGHICDRSGNALKKGLHVLGGIVDSSFRGSVGVILLNTSQDPIWIQPAMRIAQIVIKRHKSPDFVEMSADLQESARGAAGFGSSGN